MMFVEPPTSHYDVRFRVGSVPVRIHVMFWVVAVFLGLKTDGPTAPAELVIWIAAMTASILVHEFGHALMFQRFGGSPRITLYGFGGLASSDVQPRDSASQIWIAFAGPMAGFTLVGAIALLLKAAGGAIGFSSQPYAAVGLPDVDLTGLRLFGRYLYWQVFPNQHLNTLLYDLFVVNIYWGLLNLMPVYPLDGGQIAREAFQAFTGPQRGIRISLGVSILAAGAAALYAFTHGRFFMGVMFSYMAMQNYQVMAAYQSRSF
ncbi:MAG: site-2 protease family protein [Planctomycetales bacterium]|nr:site-2 protease family protein [Planctomycetales bacterium]